MHYSEDSAEALTHAAAIAAGLCAELLTEQLAAWPVDAGPCAGIVTGPGRRLAEPEFLASRLADAPAGFRCGVVSLVHAQAIVTVEVLGASAAVGWEGPRAHVAQELRAPAAAGDLRCVVRRGISGAWCCSQKARRLCWWRRSA